MSNDDNCDSSASATNTKSKRVLQSASTSSSRVTRSQWEQQNKLRALYAESQNSDPTTRAKENVHGNHQNSTSSFSMSPVPSKEERDDAKNGNSAAVTPSPNSEKGDDATTAPTPVMSSPPTKDEESPEARAARRAAWPLKDIVEPGENDCLFGRGGGTNHHPGNKRYRKIVEDRKGKYLASKRLDKPLVAMAIINDWRALDPPGRFLKQDDKTKYWTDVGDKKAREKTSQALREKTPVKQRDNGDDHHQRERTARFEPGTASPPGRHVKRSNLARDHSLGETYLGDHNAISLEGFSWDEKDATVVRDEKANVSPAPHRGPYRGEYRDHYNDHPPPHGKHRSPPYEYVREHSLSKNSLSDATVSHPAPPAFGDHPPPPYHGHGEPSSYYGHHYPGYGPPPPGGHAPPPPYQHSHPPTFSPQFSPRDHHHASYSHHQPAQQRSREHSLQMNPLKGASTSQPARDTFAEEDGHASPYGGGHRGPPPLPSPTYDSNGVPPPPPPHPPYYGYGAPSPQHGWPTPPQGPPTPQFSYHPGSNPSAFGRYDSGNRSNSLKSLGSSVDAYYDRRDSGTSRASSARSREDSSSSAPPTGENPGAAGTSQDYSKIAELIRDSSDKARSNSMDESSAGSRGGYQNTIPRSKSMPHEDSPRMSNEGKGKVVQPKVQKPSLLRKLSGGGLPCTGVTSPAAPVVKPSEGGPVCRPEPVKRDTSNQPETLETKRSIKRVVLSRDQSAVARRLKEEQRMTAPTGGGTRLSRAQMLDRQMSVEINKLGLGDRRSSSVPSLDRMTTEDVLASLIDDPEGEDGLKIPLSSPPPGMVEGDRETTIDAVARDIVNGKEPSAGDWDDALEIIDEPAPVVHSLHGAGEGGGVNADIAEKWLKGET